MEESKRWYTVYLDEPFTSRCFGILRLVPFYLFFFFSSVVPLLPLFFLSSSFCFVFRIRCAVDEWHLHRCPRRALNGRLLLFVAKCFIETHRVGRRKRAWFDVEFVSPTRQLSTFARRIFPQLLRERYRDAFDNYAGQ